MADRLQLEVHDLEVMVLTGIYSEETRLPQPLRVSVTVDLDCQPHYAPDAPLAASKNYLDLKHAATAALPAPVAALIDAEMHKWADVAARAGRSYLRDVVPG